MRHISIPAGWLEGLVDLNTEKDSVRERLAAYLTDVLSLGFSGVRIDAAKHIQPDDLVAIFSKLRRNLGGALPEDFVAWLEVLLGGEADLLMCDPDSGYNYGSYLADGLAAAGFDDADIEKIKIWNSGYPKEPANGYCTITPSRNAIQNDDADQQTDGSTSRDMGDQGCVLVEGCEEATHRAFEVQLFENPNGASDNDVDYPIRLVLSRCTPRRNNSNDKQRATKQTHSTDFDSCAHAALASVCLPRYSPPQLLLAGQLVRPAGRPLGLHSLRRRRLRRLRDDGRMGSLRRRLVRLRRRVHAPAPRPHRRQRNARLDGPRRDVLR